MTWRPPRWRRSSRPCRRTRPRRSRHCRRRTRQCRRPRRPGRRPIAPPIRDNDARLACYDRLNGRAPDAPPPSAAAQVRLQPVPAALPVAAAASSPRVDDPCTRLPEAWQRPQLPRLDAAVERWELSCRDQMPRFLPRPHRPVYLLPVPWTSRSNRTPAPSSSESPDNGVVQALDLDKNEAKFQISLKSKIWALDDHGTLSVWGAHTQNSRWQIYNGASRDRSARPLRARADRDPRHRRRAAVRLEGQHGTGLSLNHQSNGGGRCRCRAAGTG